MIKKLLLFILIGYSINTYSQKLTKEALLDVMGEETCECINTRGINLSNPDVKKLELDLGMCILESYGKHKNDAKKLLDVSFDDEESLVNLGEDVAFKMMNSCPDILMAIAGNYNDDDDYSMSMEDLPPPPPAPKNYDDLQIEAKLVSLNNDAISYIVFSDDYNKQHTFLVSEQFDDYTLLNKENFNKSFRVYYKEVDYFDLSERRYVKKKVIKFLELI